MLLLLEIKWKQLALRKKDSFIFKNFFVVLFLSVLVVRTRNVETTIRMGQNVQMYHSGTPGRSEKSENVEKL